MDRGEKLVLGHRRALAAAAFFAGFLPFLLATGFLVGGLALFEEVAPFFGAFA